MPYNNTVSEILKALKMVKIAALAVLSLMVLTGCEVEIPGGVGGKLSEADSRAVGSACRQAKRGLEECFARNPRATAAFIHEGWLEMDSYVRENGEPEFVGESSPSPTVENTPVPVQSGRGSPTGESLDVPKAQSMSSQIEAKPQEIEPTLRTSRWTPSSAGKPDSTL